MTETCAAANHAAPNNHAGLIWAIADLLRGDYKQSEYGRVILPLVLLRRLDCVLEPTKAQVLARAQALAGTVQNVDPILKAATGVEAYNTSPLTLRRILADPGQVAGNLRAWIAAFDADTRDVIEKFDFDAQIGRLDRAKLLYLVLSKVTEVDLRLDKVTNVEMGYKKAEGRTDDLAFGRMDGRLPLDDLPPRLPPGDGGSLEPQRRDHRDRLARRPGPASPSRGWTAWAPEAGVAIRTSG